VINPDDIVEEYGADSLRLYEMFMGPLEQVKPWSTKDVEGVYRFLNRVWRLTINEDTGALDDAIVEEEPGKKQLKILHETIKKVTEDIEDLRFNTAISQMMSFVNEANKWEQRPKSVLEQFVILLSPFASHMTEELWHRLGHEETIAYAEWPEYNEEFLIPDTQNFAVQVNGKVRGQLEVPTEKVEDKQFVLEQAKEQGSVQKYLEKGEIVKEIFVPGKIVNFVVKE
jgi:leucyl-tRNA synthetase